MHVLYVCRSEDGLAVAQLACQEMSENLRRVTQDKQSIDLRTAAELDDLYRTKINLEERLVELIRYKYASYYLRTLVFCTVFCVIFLFFYCVYKHARWSTLQGERCSVAEDRCPGV